MCTEERAYVYSLRDFVAFVDAQTVLSRLIGGILTSKVSCNRRATIQYDDFKEGIFYLED